MWNRIRSRPTSAPVTASTDVAASADPASNTTVVSYHHDRPLYIVKGQAQGNNIRNAPFINHTDQELTLIEALVGRTPPFVFANDTTARPDGITRRTLQHNTV